MIRLRRRTELEQGARTTSRLSWGSWPRPLLSPQLLLAPLARPLPSGSSLSCWAALWWPWPLFFLEAFNLKRHHFSPSNGRFVQIDHDQHTFIMAIDQEKRQWKLKTLLYISTPHKKETTTPNYRHQRI
jgi:hypothetical protein